MKTLVKVVLGGLMLVGTAAATAAPANAGVSVGVNLGAPGPAVAYGYGNHCFRPYWNRPGYCRYPVYGAPIFVNGGRYREPVYYRNDGGERYFWIHNGWMRDRDDFHRGRNDFGDHHDWRADHGWHSDRGRHEGDRG